MNNHTESSALPASGTHPDVSGALWVLLRQRLLRHARMMVFEPAQAEDMVQESLVAVLEKPEAHRGEASLSTWAVAILKHKIADWYRSPHQRRRSWVETDDNEAEADPTQGLYDEQGSHKEAVPSWQQPEKLETQRQMMSVMEACLKRLPAQTGRVCRNNGKPVRHHTLGLRAFSHVFFGLLCPAGSQTPRLPRGAVPQWHQSRPWSRPCGSQWPGPE